MAEPTWRQVETLPPGEYVAACRQAEAVDSQAGNPCVRWTFEVEGTEVRLAYTTVRRRRETGLVAQALGLPKAFRLSQALDRRCRITVAKDGSFMKVTGARPL